jgi:replicative DNA helicase
MRNEGKAMTEHAVETSSQELEMTILGSMINSQEHLESAQKAIKEDDFADIKNKIIFRAISETQKEKGVVDVTILGETLKKADKFQEVGGYSYLMDLSNFAGTSAHVEAYCEDLRQLSVKRALINVHKSIADDLNNGVEPYKALERILTKVEDIKKNKPKADSLFSHLLDPTSEQEIIDEIRHTSSGARVGFKIGEIDLELPGGANTIVAGPTGHGKTLLMINFNLGYLEKNPDKQVFFFSYEESRSAIATLFLNTYANQDLSINNRKSIKSFFRDGHMQYVAENKRQECLRNFIPKKEEFFTQLISSGRLNIIYSDYYVEELIEAIFFIKKNTNVGLITIDYIQLLKLLNKRNILPRQEELKHICLMLKDCAVETGLPILLGAQFNRTVSCEADLSPTAIGEAGDIERAANMIIGIWNRNFEGFGREGNIGKNKQQIPKESAMYLEILKGREVGIGHSSVYNLNGNTGKLSPKDFVIFKAQDVKSQKR